MVALIQKTKQIKMLKLNKLKKRIPKLDDPGNEPLFIKVKFRETVLVGEGEIYKVLSFVKGARDSLAPTLTQVANVDAGEIKCFHRMKAKEIVCSYDQKQLKR